MIFYSDQNIAKANAKKNTFPTTVYLPLNTGRTVAAQKQAAGSYIDQRPSDAISLGNWIEHSQQVGILRPYANVKSVSADYTANALKDVVIISTGTTTVTLPDATENTKRVFVIRNNDAALVTTVDDAGGNNVDGAATDTLAAKKTATYLSDGTEWHVISN